MLDLVIRNGEVVTPQGVGRWTVGICGEQIAYVGIDDPSMQAGRTIEAEGKIVVPGGIEPHAHLDIFDLTNPDSGRSTLGPEEDTRGMAFGGTTTHLDFCFVEPSMEMTKAIEERCARWKGNSFVDYSFHVGLMGALPLKTFDQLADVIKQGFPSFKVFTTDVLPPHPKRISVRLDMGRIQLAMEKVAKNDGIMVVHAEDDEIVQFNYQRFAEEGRTEGHNLHLVHTKLSEELAFERIIGVARASGAALTRMPLPYSGARVRVMLQETIRGNNVKEGCARIYLVWNTVGSWRSDEKMPDVDLVITTADLPHYPDIARLTVREHGRHAAHPLAGVKTISWLDSVWAVAEAQREGFDEVVLLNERGEVSECTAANIFAAKNGKVITPPLSSGCLEGVTRGVLMEIAGDASTSVVEQTVRLEDLYAADEVFMTSTNRNVIGVKEIAGHTIADGKTGPITQKLDEAFEAYINDYVERRLATSR